MKRIIYFICSFMLFLSSCMQEDLTDIPGTSGSIVLKVIPDALLVDTRGTEQGDNQLNENKISNIHVFFFPQNAADNVACIRHEAYNGLTFQGTGTFSKDLTTPRSLFSPNTTYDVYTVVNLPGDVTISDPITLGGLKSLRTLTPISGTSLQTSFVMDGKTSVVLNPTQATAVVNIDMPVKRAAAKIRVKFVLAPGSDLANATVAQVSLRHFALSSSFLNNFPYGLTAADYGNSSYVTGTPATTFTFYCYENNWGSAKTDETYLMVNLPYIGTTSNYYRISVNKYADNPETGRIARNMIYDVTAYINQPGALSESGAVSVNSNCVITDWTTKTVVLKTISQHYLGISEYNIVMPNVSTFTLNYVADLPVAITNVTATCTQYNTSGTASTVTYTTGQSQFPTFTINAAASTVTINSTIPVNYVPKYITFTVTNNQGLNLNVSVVQYPSRYVTARLSTGNVKPEWLTGGTNLNLFTVNTLVPSSDGSYVLGDPTNGGAKTDSTAIGNTMVSPRFIIASQYGIYSRVTYSVAQNRCFLYGEDIYRSGWRLPTKAEIELVNKIQDDPNSAVKALLTGDAYWSAYKYDYYDFVNNGWTSVTSSGTAYVRAVYDLYKYEQ